MPTVWFIIIAVLWVGYFVLEGFDFGVGTLLPILGRDDRERRVLINTIGPVWDGNEVWVLTAGGATFAAFPEWYASLFSGFYLALLLILVALILRGVAFEYRGKRDDLAWRKRWDAALFLGSLLPAFLWGVAFANIVRGVPLSADHEYTGNLLTLLNPYGLLGGLTTLGLFVTHGAFFLASSKVSRTLRSDSPTYMSSSSGPLTEMKFMSHSVATAFATRVLPVPGGPYSKMARRRGTEGPNSSGYLSGISIV